MTPEELIAEVRVVRIPSHRERWRWDVIWQSRAEGLSPGVLDARVHQDHDFGYTWTWWGAWWRIARAYRKPPARLSQGFRPAWDRCL
jgi:hypothetical protein